MTKKLFVGNLSFNTTNDSLTNAFSEYGNVQEVKIITDRDTNRSKGFAFIKMDKESEAQSAITSLNGSELEGRNIVVSVAKEMEQRERTTSRRW